MAKLVDIYNSEKEPVIKRRQLPLTIYENLTVSGFMHFDITTSVDNRGRNKTTNYLVLVAKSKH